MRLIVSRGGYSGSPIRRFPCSTLSARTSGKSLSRASKARDVSNTDTSESESIGREALAGVLLGLRFKVLILVPCILIIACAIVATGDGLKAITLTILATAVLIQIGYGLGLIVRFWAGRYLSKRRPALTSHLSRSQ